jgi:hypothetical protein
MDKDQNTTYRWPREEKHEDGSNVQALTLLPDHGEGGECAKCMEPKHMLAWSTADFPDRVLPKQDRVPADEAYEYKIEYASRDI